MIHRVTVSVDHFPHAEPSKQARHQSMRRREDAPICGSNSSAGLQRVYPEAGVEYRAGSATAPGISPVLLGVISPKNVPMWPAGRRWYVAFSAIWASFNPVSFCAYGHGASVRWLSQFGRIKYSGLVGVNSSNINELCLIIFCCILRNSLKCKDNLISGGRSTCGYVPWRCIPRLSDPMSRQSSDPSGFEEYAPITGNHSLHGQLNSEKYPIKSIICI